MSHVFHREPGRRLPMAVRGEGAYVIDGAGRRYLDASGFAAVSSLGHSHPRVIEAVQRQLAALSFAHTGFFTNEPMEALADALAAEAPEGLDKVLFVSSGSEAVEAALKLARQYFLEVGQPLRRRFIARRQSYHGATLGALSVGGNRARRVPYAPLLFEVTHIAPCYAYRDRRAGESEDAYAIRVADELDAAIQSLGPETVAGFIAEPVVGATLGAVPALPGYFKRISEICDRHGVLRHGQTYLGHAAACAAGLAVQRVIKEERLLDNVRRQGAALKAALDERFAQHPHVGDIRGRGLLLGLELVADRASKAPFDPTLRLHAELKSAALEEGLICYPMGGTIDGVQGDHVLLAPPFIVTDAELDLIVARLAAALERAFRLTEV